MNRGGPGSVQSGSFRPLPLEHLVAAHPLLFWGRTPAGSHLPQGWHGLLDKLCTDIDGLLEPAGCADFEALQITPKYGSLRFYYQVLGGSDQHVDIISGDGHGHLVVPRPAQIPPCQPRPACGIWSKQLGRLLKACVRAAEGRAVCRTSEVFSGPFVISTPAEQPASGGWIDEAHFARPTGET